MEFIKPTDRPTMDIRASVGDSVRFVYPTHGSTEDQRWALAHLEVGKVYTVERVKPHGDFATDVFLIEVPGVPFNSALFKDIG